MFDYAKKFIKEVYPKTNVVGKPIPGFTEKKEIFVKGNNRTV